jgi:PadR family transcriptional regulator, regulatory protein AphA
VLPRLVSSGLATSEAVAQRGRLYKSLYEITPLGLETLRAWLEDVGEPVGGGVEYVLKLFFCEFASARAALGQLGAYRRMLERRLEAYEALEEPGDRSYPQHTLQHGLARVRATLAWIDDTAAAIESGAPVSSAVAPRRDA